MLDTLQEVHEGLTQVCIDSSVSPELIFCLRYPPSRIWQAVRSPKCLHAVSVVYTLRVRCSVCPHQHLSFNYLLTISFKLHLFLFVPVRIHTLISCTAMTVTSCTIFWAEWGLNVLGRGLLVLLPVMDMTVGLLKIFMSDSGACV